MFYFVQDNLMFKKLLTLQELSLELSSDLGVYGRLIDSIDATNYHEAEDISTESSSPFLRAIGLQSDTKINKFTLIGYLVQIAYTVAKDMYRKNAHFYSVLKDAISYLKEHTENLPSTIKSNDRVIYSPDMYSQQTMTLNSNVLDKKELFNAINSFMGIFKILTDTHIKNVFESSTASLDKPDPGYTTELLKTIKSRVNVLNNTTISYKKKSDGSYEWKADTIRSRNDKNIKMSLDSDDVKDLYQCMVVSVEMLEKSVKHSYFDYSVGTTDAKKRYDVVHKMYIDLYATMVRIVFLMNEMYHTFKDTVEAKNV